MTARNGGATLVKAMSEISREGRSKRRAAAVSVASNTCLVLGKLVVGVMTSSVAVISEAVHSAMDLLAAVIAFVAVSLSDRPPDLDHPHGHGKIESLSGAIEALLIFCAVVFIGYEAIEKLIHGGAVERIHLGAIVMGGSAVVNTVVSCYLQRVGTRADSEALLADAAHLRTDVYTSLGVFAGLLLVHFTGVQWLDPVTALVVALLIVREAWLITRRSVGNLLDESLPATDRAAVEAAMRDLGVSFHALRSRKSGSARKIDLHLEVPATASAASVHALCDRIEEAIHARLPNAQVLIHPEPAVESGVLRDADTRVNAILAQHRRRLRGYRELRVCNCDGTLHIALRCGVAPTTTAEEIDELSAHLGRHINEQLPGAQVFIQTFAVRDPGDPP